MQFGGLNYLFTVQIKISSFYIRAIKCLVFAFLFYRIYFLKYCWDVSSLQHIGSSYHFWCPSVHFIFWAVIKHALFSWFMYWMEILLKPLLDSILLKWKKITFIFIYYFFNFLGLTCSSCRLCFMFFFPVVKCNLVSWNYSGTEYALFACEKYWIQIILICMWIILYHVAFAQCDTVNSS